MAIKLGKDGDAPPFGVDIISASFTEEVESVDITNRTNDGGSSGSPGYRCYDAGFVSRTWEIECHDASGLVTQLETNSPTSDFIVMNVTENVSIDGAVTYTITAREGGITGGGS
jgi:hypothetical protein